MDKTITVPDWLFRVLDAIYHNVDVGLISLLSMVVLSALAYVFNKKVSKKRLQAIQKSTIHVFLVVVSAVFGFLGQAIPYLHDNLAVFRNVPHVGEYIVGIYAGANFLYAVRLKTWFKAIDAWLNKEDGTTSKLAGLPELQPTETTPESNFETLA